MTIDRGAIDRQLREIGEGEHWWEEREFRDLPHVLHADECILGIAHGKLIEPIRPRLRPARRWLIVATDQRLLCLRHERFGRKHVDITSGQITRIDQNSRFRTFEVTVRTERRKYRIRIRKGDAFRFARAIAPLVPSRPERPGRAALGPLAAVPGISAITALPGVERFMSNLAIINAPEYMTRADVQRIEGQIESLQVEVDRLREQVAFLEDLLKKRAQENALHSVPGVEA